jgi:hypothetical protein
MGNPECPDHYAELIDEILSRMITNRRNQDESEKRIFFKAGQTRKSGFPA